MVGTTGNEQRPRAGDEGFSIIEVLMSLTLIGITLASMGPFFITSFLSVSYQRTQQAATELANSGLEQVRALKGSSLLTGRGKIKSTEQWASAPASITPYLNTMQLTWDPLITDLTSTLGADAAISTSPQTMTVQQTTYSRQIFVGVCDIYIGGTGNCVNPSVVTPPADSTKDLQFFRAVVLVTWPGKDCVNNLCTYVTSTLVARASEPTFDFHRPAPLIKTFTYTFYKGVAASAQLEATGGQLPNTWTSTTNPAGMTLTPAGVLSGTPTTLGTYTSQVKVTDKLGRADIETVQFIVLNPPTLAQPAAAKNHVGETVSQTLTTTGGQSPYTYAATGLPAGLTLNTSTGVISGTVTTLGTYTVSATSTDASGGTSTKTWTHTVYPVLTIATIPDQSINLGQTFTATAIGSGGDNAFTYSATGMPVGVTMNPTTGVMSGLPTISGRYLPTVTVTDGLGGTAKTMFVLLVNTTSSLIWTTPSFTAADQTSTAGTPTSVSFKNNGSTLGLNPVMTSTGMPPGVTFNTLTGTASGTPTTPGTYPVTVTAVNLLPPQTTSYTFLWTVK
jgi:type II secretory pathway pseudopilin PulG